MKKNESVINFRKNKNLHKKSEYLGALKDFLVTFMES